MKLAYFTEQTLPKGARGGGKKPSISFGSNGVLAFNKPATELIGLNEGDKISIAQDEDEPANWYVFLDPVNGFAVKAKDRIKQPGHLSFNHSALKNTFLDCFQLDNSISQTYFIAQEATVFGKVKYWGILVPIEAAEGEEK